MSIASTSLPVAPDQAPDEALQLLDDPQEWSAFSRPYGNQGNQGNQANPTNCWESRLLIEGMHCAACAITVEEALQRVPGVLKAEVSAGSHRARVVWRADAVLPSDWMQAVQTSGYRAVPANDAFARDRRQLESRKALWRMLVAGLCMMQVMMYAWPAYIAQPGDLTPEMEQLLRWASWVLTLPVILFSCGPFFSSAWQDLLHRRVSMDLPVALGMAITFVVSTAGTFEPNSVWGREVYFDSLTMFVFFLLAGRWLELRLRSRTAGALEALMNRLPDSVARLKADGAWERVAVRRLLPGDLLRLVPGECFPADGTLMKGSTLVDEALLTGESHPLLRGQGDPVIAGSYNLSAVVEMRVDQVGENTRFASIVALMESASGSKPQLARLADRIAKPFLLAVLLAAGLSAVFWWSRDPAQALMVAVAVLVVTCPCALSLATPAAMLAAAGALARNGVLVRQLNALEALAAVDTVIFDKTGTLTRDALVLFSTRVREGVTPEQALAMAAALARQSLHPVSKALAVAASQAPAAQAWLADQVIEIPGQGLSGQVFPHAPLHEAGQGGAITPVPQLLRLGSASFCALAPQDADRIQAHLSDAQGWLATFDLQEDVRPDALATLNALQQAGVALHIVSGDQPQAVARVAQGLGLRNYQAACSPQDKLDALQRLQQAGHQVAVVGDGLNDGPLLAGAQVSFALGQAVPLAQSKADFVVLGDQLMGVASSLLLARRTLRVVRQNLAWAAAYNAVCVPLAVVGWLPAWLAGLGMASSSLLVVLNALRLSRSRKLASPQ
jgi:Cu2+-exporting ATPase